ncbi:MAG: type II secretion system protein [Planctomycetota bacterium]
MVARPARRTGFTLQEMLVVCAILILLAGLIAFRLPGVKEIAQETQCRANMGAFARICLAFAMSNDDAPERADRLALPKGRVDNPSIPGSLDNYLLMNTDAYQELVDDYDLRPEAATCRSLMLVPDEKREWMLTQSGKGTYLGLIYWCGREDVVDQSTGADIFRSARWQDVHRREDPNTGMWEEYSPTTRMVATCWMVMATNTGGGGGNAPGPPENESWMPHVGSRSLQYAAGTAWEDMKRPDGIAASYLDGSARWVEFSDGDDDMQDDNRRLLPLQQLHTIWYAPD